jgi:ribosomal protein S18 acetylase RimI-like enzyme
MSEASFQIVPAVFAADLDIVKRLFTAYASALGIDLSYQGFEAELAGLPGKYAAPAGALLIARGTDSEPLGCVALRPIAPDGCCEMKRLYVSPRARGLGLGKALVDAVIAEATRIGYREMRLDTLPTMGEAISLYRKAGFLPIAPYYETPVAGTIFMGRRLNRDDSTP